MVELSLQEITSANWRECVNLSLHPNQQHFVATNAMSLVQATYEPNFYPRAIYATDEMVGFIMYGSDTYQEREIWGIWRLMIDKAYQGNGYGATAIQLAIQQMQVAKPEIDDLYISFVPENHAARKVYERLGFVDVGMTPDGKEVLMHRSLAAGA